MRWIQEAPAIYQPYCNLSITRRAARGEEKRSAGQEGSGSEGIRALGASGRVPVRSAIALEGQGVQLNRLYIVRER